MKIEVLKSKLAKDFPDINFEKSNRACWSPTNRTVYYDDSIDNLIHELGHAMLGHNTFSQDIELIHIERDAWEQAQIISKIYKVNIHEDTVENAIDNYREWIHRRSLCPNCRQTGIQSQKDLNYYCINCNTHWKANDARSCGLKRRIVNKKPPLSRAV